MQASVIRYTVRAGSVDENTAKVRAVLQELRHTAPAGIRYMVLAGEHGEFIHIALSETGDARSLTQLPAFQQFQANHNERRLGELTRTTFELLGEYRPDHP